MKIIWEELTIAQGTSSPDELLSEWRWLLVDYSQIVLISALGDLFLADAAGHIHWLDVGTGQVTEIASGLDAFERLRQDPDKVDEWFIPQLVGDILQSGVRLEPGQCFSYKVPPILGGDVEPANFTSCDLSVHFGVLGQINRQVRDFPDGTTVKIKID